MGWFGDPVDNDGQCFGGCAFPAISHEHDVTNGGGAGVQCRDNKLILVCIVRHDALIRTIRESRNIKLKKS